MFFHWDSVIAGKKKTDVKFHLSVLKWFSYSTEPNLSFKLKHVNSVLSIVFITEDIKWIMLIQGIYFYALWGNYQQSYNSSKNKYHFSGAEIILW